MHYNLDTVDMLLVEYGLHPSGEELETPIPGAIDGASRKRKTNPSASPHKISSVAHYSGKVKVNPTRKRQRTSQSVAKGKSVNPRPSVFQLGKRNHVKPKNAGYAQETIDLTNEEDTVAEPEPMFD